ncbi:hypothetical protein D3C83_316100 [compost metagenome]
MRGVAEPSALRAAFIFSASSFIGSSASSFGSDPSNGVAIEAGSLAIDSSITFIVFIDAPIAGMPMV